VAPDDGLSAATPAGPGNYRKVMSAMQPPRPATWARSAWITGLAIPVATSLVLLAPTAAYANVSLTRISHDIYTDTQAQHDTEVEPGVARWGSTVVSAFQVGRVFGGGASNIGWATSTNGGATWSHGYLPGITANGGGPFGQASDASVAYDAKASVWLIASLGLGTTSVDVLASRSTDGGLTWGNPVTVASGSNDKDWVTCDNTATSPHYGNCYAEYDIPGDVDSLRMRTSTNGGASWGPARQPTGGAHGLGGQPVAGPHGEVVVPYEAFASGLPAIRSFDSTNGGASWSATTLVSSVHHRRAHGDLRESPLPSAGVDAAGTVYVAWADCRFRPGCVSNDIVMAKSTGPATWAAPVRVPIAPVSTAGDYFIPGLGVDAATSGTGARIGLSYYYYPNASCTAPTCRLDAGFISSVNGGTTWSAAARLAGPMRLSWLPNTSQGRMFGDYISTTVLAGGNAYPILPVAKAPTGSTFHQAMYVPTGGLAVTGGTRRATTGPVFATAPAHRPARVPAPPTAH
jgi:hypothetical protein